MSDEGIANSAESPANHSRLDTVGGDHLDSRPATLTQGRKPGALVKRVGSIAVVILFAINLPVGLGSGHLASRSGFRSRSGRLREL